MKKSQCNILGVITARGGSKGVPRKNVKLLGDKPLIAYTIEAARKSRLITDLIVSTEDEGIAAICREYGADVPFMRPLELATDTASHLSVMQHAIKFMEDKKGIVYDYAVILQPTSPFRTVEDIDGTIEKIIEHEADSSYSMCEVEGKDHPLKIKKMNGDKVISYHPDFEEPYQRQGLTPAYKRSCAVYVIKRDLIMKDGRLFGDRAVGHIVPKDRSIDIDNELDWLKAEYMFKRLKDEGFY